MSYYCMNIAGFKLNDKQMECISCPRFELGSHIQIRTMQLCSVVGGAMVGPTMALYNGKTDRQGIMDSVWYHGGRGFKTGTVLGGVLALGYGIGLDKDGTKDRCYRLRYNKYQVFVDRVTWGSTLVGLGAAYYLGDELAKGAWYGFTGGCLAAGLVNIASGYL